MGECGIEKEITTQEEIAAIEREIRQLEEGKGKSYKSKIDLSEELGLKDNQDTVDEPIFYTATQIKQVKKDRSQIVPSGINLIDKKIMGFNLGELSIWSGTNGSGKSSLLSQLALESIDNNFNVALFSGELRADRVLNWVQLQASRKELVKQTEYDNYYIVPSDVRSKVNKWLDSKLFIYNNNKGLSVEGVIKAIDDCIVKNNIKVVIIDNLMALSLSSMKGEKYDRQTDLVIALSGLAKKRNVHCHFVCHPRKLNKTFLRKEDISGTSDISNLADNVFLVSRVTRDFKKAIKEFLGIKDDNPLLNFDNVVEIAKNRDMGVSDLFVGLYFEKETKRFLNTQIENKHYGWEGFVQVNEETIPFKKEGESA